MYNDFIFDITKIPGSSDDVIQQAILYYSNKLNDSRLPEELKNIARAFVGNLTQFYEMSNLNSQNLRGALVHFSEAARFMDSLNNSNVDIESTGRIKSLFSVYQKILDKSIECIERNQPIPEKDILRDIYATRDVLYPRYDMKLHPEAFYKLTYKIVLEYMKFIDNLHAKDSRYELAVLSDQFYRNMARPKKFSNPSKLSIDIPQKDFIDYSLENEDLEHGFRYIADLFPDFSAKTLANDIIQLQTRRYF